MNGVLLVDKPAGMTSFDVVRRVRRICQTRRVGHAGTLDPLATGVLPVAVGWATRLVEYLMAGDKIYRATLRLGIATDTQDAEGRILSEHPWQHVDRTTFESVAAGFVGTIEQLPPMYSALKRDGKPLYQLARQGIEVERQRRTVFVERLQIDAFAPPYVTFTVQCSKGTYVRTLCDDIGRQLGCAGHMTALRRLGCGRFELSASHPLEELQALAEQGLPLPLLSPAEALADWPALLVGGATLARLRNGVAPASAELDSAGLAAGERVRFLAGDSLVAIARYAPQGRSNKPGDFEILKVVPILADQG